MTFVPKLYFSPGAVSMATHMALEEAGLPYTLEPILIKEGQQLSEQYRRVHPLGRLPALEVEPGVVLTETPALLAYVASLAPALHLLPEGMSRSQGGWAVRALLLPFLDRKDPELLGRLHIDGDGYVAMEDDDRSQVVALTPDGAMEVICRFIERAVLSSMPHAILK